MDDDKHDADWLDAIAIADEGGPLAPLIDQLRSKAPMSRQARGWLADLLERHQKLRKKPGGQANPIWDPSDAEVRLSWAESVYERLCKDGLSHDAAIKEAIKLIPSGKVKILQNYMDGRRGASNRQQKRPR